MKTNRGIGRVVVLAVATGLCWPQEAEAGRKERDMAIKILTGAAFFSAMHQAARQRTVTVRRSAHSRPSSRGYTHRSSNGYRRSVGRQAHGDTVRRPRASSCRRAPAEPIVLQIDTRTRLYQPRVRGHQAFLQRWCRRSGAWVTERVHPSIW